MLVPSIFGDTMFNDWMEDFPFRGHMPEMQVNQLMKTDIREHEKGYELDIDLPGFKKEDIKAVLKDGYLTIEAHTNQNNDEKDKHGKYIRRERYVGSCSRSFYVGEDMTEEDIRAKFEDGILKLSIPKKELQPKVEQKKYISIEG